MKIGVALSGCDIGGVCAWKALDALKACGLDIGMVSACCAPAAAALMYCGGSGEEAMQRLSENFLKEAKELDIDSAIVNFSAAYKPGKGIKIPLAINAVNVADGNVATFTDHYCLKGGNIKTYGMCDPYDMLSATISFMGGLSSYCYRNKRLCDYGCWYGCPIAPLKLAGFKKTVSLVYLPKTPKAPYEAIVKRMTVCEPAADAHIVTELGGDTLSFAENAELIMRSIDENADKIVLNMLF